MLNEMIVTVPTPFKGSGDVDNEALKKHIEWLIREQVDGIVVCSVAGEGSTLSEEEFLEVVKTAVKAADKKVPIFAMAGTNDTLQTVRRIKEIKRYGAAGALVIVPYYNRPSAEGCIKHFQEAAKCGLPIIACHHPSRTGVKLNAATWVEILAIPEVIALKESSGDVDFVRELLPLTSKPILCGDDPSALAMIQIGVMGVVSTFGNLAPKEWKEMIQSVKTNHLEKAFALHHQFEKLCRALHIESEPQGIKFAMHLLDKCALTMRLPMVEPRETTKQLIVAELICLGLIPQQKGTAALNLDTFLKEDPLPL
jgi:4-hydroxy-tetrahydrodipicolinate synthase